MFFYTKFLYICTIKLNKGTNNEKDFYHRPHDEAMEVFAEAVHAFNLDDDWDGHACVVQASEDAETLVIREISLPA